MNSPKFYVRLRLCSLTPIRVILSDDHRPRHRLVIQFGSLPLKKFRLDRKSGSYVIISLVTDNIELSKNQTAPRRFGCDSKQVVFDLHRLFKTSTVKFQLRLSDEQCFV